MSRLYIFCEGQTDEAFVNDVLVAHLARRGVYAVATVLNQNHDRRGVRIASGGASLAAEIGSLPPEDVDDGPTTAPSKRLESHLGDYQKTAMGPLVLHDAGLDVIRAACPRFHAWLERLESLMTPADGAAQC